MEANKKCFFGCWWWRQKYVYNICPFVTHNNKKLLSSCVIYFTYFVYIIVNISFSSTLVYKSGDNTIYMEVDDVMLFVRRFIAKCHFEG